jgi:hypothetical protein
MFSDAVSNRSDQMSSREIRVCLYHFQGKPQLSMTDQCYRLTIISIRGTRRLASTVLSDAPDDGCCRELVSCAPGGPNGHKQQRK